MLHGNVQINHHEIVTFEVCNAGPGYEAGSRYECVVEGRDKQGYPYTFRFELEAHTTAPGLVALVMEEVHRRLTD